MTITTWTEDRDAQLRRLLEAGATYREISTEMGVTRNSIGGRANRLGIASKVTRADGSRLRSELRKEREPVKAMQLPAGQRLTPTHRKILGLAPVYKAPPLRCVEVEPLCLTFMELERGQCKYPSSDSPLTFCGHPAINGKPYCAPHNALTMKQEVYQC